VSVDGRGSSMGCVSGTRGDVGGSVVGAFSRSLSSFI
jgi:hypothetical protein